MMPNTNYREPQGASGSPGDQPAQASSPRRWAPALLAGLAALVLGLFVANGIALWGRMHRSRQASVPNAALPPAVDEGRESVRESESERVKNQEASAAADLPTLPPSHAPTLSPSHAPTPVPPTPPPTSPAWPSVVPAGQPRTGEGQGGVPARSPSRVGSKDVAARDPKAWFEGETSSEPRELRLLPLIAPERVEGFKRVPVRLDEPATAEAVSLSACFRSVPCDGLVKPPMSLAGALRFREEGKDVVVTHGRLIGVGRVDILRCSADPRRGLLLEAPGDQVARSYEAVLRNLVIEAADLKGQTVYQMMLSRAATGAITPNLGLWYDGRGASRTVGWSFAYPWPEALLVQHPKLNAGEPVSLSQLCQRAVAGGSGLRAEPLADRGSGPAVLLTFRGDSPDSGLGDATLALRLGWGLFPPGDENGTKRVDAALSLGLKRSATVDEMLKGTQDVLAPLFARAGAVTLSDPWNQPVCILKPTIARVPSRREPAYPSKAAGAQVRFEVDPCVTVLDLPPALEGRFLTGKLADGVFTVSHFDEGNWIPLVRCKLNERGGPIEWAVDESAARRFRACVDSLVIEAIDAKAGLVRQCMRSRKPAKRSVTAQYSDAGTSGLSSKAGEASFLYPWPKTLLARHPDVNEGKPAGLFTDLKGSIVIRRSAEGPSTASFPRAGKAGEIDLRLSFRFGNARPPSGGAQEVSVRASSDTLAKRAKFARTMADQEANKLRREIADLERREIADLDMKIERKVRLQEQYSPSSAAYRKCELELDDLRLQRDKKKAMLDPAGRSGSPTTSEIDAFADLKDVEILDAWGVPVATIAPSLEGASGGGAKSKVPVYKGPTKAGSLAR